MDTVGRIFEPKEISMKWLKRLIWQWNQEGRELTEYGNTVSTRLQRGSRNEDIEADEGLNITVRKAVGGKIISFRHYDHRQDRTDYKL